MTCEPADASQRLGAPCPEGPASPVASEDPSRPVAMQGPLKSGAAQGRRPPAPLLRTTSMMKLRRLCNQQCDAIFLKSLQQSVGRVLLEVRAAMFVLLVHVCISCLVLQLTACLCALVGKPPPPGLLFMVASLLAIMAAYSRLLANVVKRNARPARRVVFTGFAARKKVD